MNLGRIYSWNCWKGRCYYCRIYGKCSTYDCFTAVAALGMAPWQGDMGAVVASCSEYTWLTKGKHIDGTMYSCTSLEQKIGGGIGVCSLWMAT